MRMRGGGAAVLLAVTILIALASVGRAQAETRVALVIGNSAYQNVARLTNPTADAQAVAETLKVLGFDTMLVLDQDGVGLKQALRGFASKAKGADIAAIYYAGHGMEADGQNYLIPVDATLKSDEDIDFELIPLDLVLRTVSGAKRLRLVMLDACRNNPFEASMQNAGGGRAIGRGLVRVEPPNNTLVAYAAKAGTIADDGDGAHSPFATALLQNLAQPGQEVRLAFGKVRDDVLAATGNRQEPFVYGSLGGAPIYLVPGSGEAQAPAATSQPAAGDREALFWASIKDSSNPAMFEAYLQKYPNGDFATLAQAKLAELQAQQTAALTPETTPALLETPSSAASAPEIDAMDATYVALQSANIRAAPSTDAKVLAKLKADDAVSATGKVKGKDWLQVKSGDSTGYVSAKLLIAADAEEAVAWKKLKAAPSEESAQDFLKRFPAGAFEPRAKALLATLMPPIEPEAGPAAPPAPPVDAMMTLQRLLRDVEVRSAPESGSVIGQLKHDSYVTVSGRVRGLPWVRVLFDGEKKTGYIKEDALVAAAAPMNSELFAATQSAPTATVPAAATTDEMQVGQTYLYVSRGRDSQRGLFMVDAQPRSGEFSGKGEMSNLYNNYQLSLTFSWDGERLIVKGIPINGYQWGTMRLSLAKIGAGQYSGKGSDGNEVTLTLKGM